MNKPLASYQGDQTAVAPARGRLTFDLMDPAAFQHIQRVAGMYAASPLFPDHLRKGGQTAALANAVLVMNIAERLREDPLTVAQQIYFVGGKPGWAATYMIAKANQHGVFKNPIDWTVKGEGDALSVTAHAELAGTKKKVEVTIDMETAKAEGWTRNAKYKSMPEQMLRYRSATALIRLYCPEVMIGVPPANEVEDRHYAMRDVTPDEGFGGAPAPALDMDEPEADAPDVDEAEIEQEEPKVRKPVSRTPPKPAEPEPEPEAEDVTEEEEAQTKPEAKAEPEPEPEPEKKAEPETQSKPADPEPAEERWAKLRQSVVADLEGTDGALDPVVSFYRDKLKEMRDQAPDVFDALEDEIGEDIGEKL